MYLFGIGAIACVPVHCASTAAHTVVSAHFRPHCATSDDDDDDERFPFHIRPGRSIHYVQGYAVLVSFIYSNVYMPYIILGYCMLVVLCVHFVRTFATHPCGGRPTRLLPTIIR